MKLCYVQGKQKQIFNKLLCTLYSTAYLTIFHAIISDTFSPFSDPITAFRSVLPHASAPVGEGPETMQLYATQFFYIHPGPCYMWKLACEGDMRHGMGRRG